MTRLASVAMQFRTSLGEMARIADKAKAAQEREAGALGLSGDGTLASHRAPSPLDIWLEGRYTGFNDDAARLDRKGGFGIVYLGADYRVHPNILIGALVQQDWASERSAVLSDVDGRGWMAGPYISMRLWPAIFLDMRAAWGRSSNDITVGTATGSFDTDRWLAKAKLIGTGNPDRGADAQREVPRRGQQRPSSTRPDGAGSDGALSRPRSGRDRLQAALSGQSSSRSRPSWACGISTGQCADPQWFDGCSKTDEHHQQTPRLWDFDRPNAPILNGFVVDADGFRGRVEAGFTLLASPAWYLRAAGGYDGIGSGTYHAYTVQGVINVPLN